MWHESVPAAPAPMPPSTNAMSSCAACDWLVKNAPPANPHRMPPLAEPATKSRAHRRELDGVGCARQYRRRSSHRTTDATNIVALQVTSNARGRMFHRTADTTIELMTLAASTAP